LSTTYSTTCPRNGVTALLSVTYFYNSYRSGRPSGENHVVDQESALLANASPDSSDAVTTSPRCPCSPKHRCRCGWPTPPSSSMPSMRRSSFSAPLGLIRDHLEMVKRLNLIESDVVGCIYKRALRPSHSAGTGVMVIPVDPLARPAWTPRSRPPTCPRRVVWGPGVVVRSPFGPPRSQHRGVA
jgi:hypothetical protein